MKKTIGSHTVSEDGTIDNNQEPKIKPKKRNRKPVKVFSWNNVSRK